MHVAEPVRVAQRLALVHRDRCQRKLLPPPVHDRQVLEVQPPVQRGQRALRAVLEEREVDHVDVEMQHVELVHACPQLVQHRHVRGEVGFQRGGIQADGLIAHRHQPCARLGFGGGEQRDVVAGFDQGVAQPGHHAFGAAVELGRHRFVQRGNLRNLQNRPPSAAASRPRRSS
jgi:hypothetical protein